MSPASPNASILRLRKFAAVMCSGSNSNITLVAWRAWRGWVSKVIEIFVDEHVGTHGLPNNNVIYLWISLTVVFVVEKGPTCFQKGNHKYLFGYTQA